MTPSQIIHGLEFIIVLGLLWLFLWFTLRRKPNPGAPVSDPARSETHTEIGPLPYTPPPTGVFWFRRCGWCRQSLDGCELRIPAGVPVEMTDGICPACKSRIEQQEMPFTDPHSHTRFSRKLTPFHA